MTPIFDAAHVQTSIDQVLKQSGAPADHTKAFILTGKVHEHDGSLEAVYVQKLSRGWSVAGEFAMQSSGEMSGGGAVVWTGK